MIRKWTLISFFFFFVLFFSLPPPPPPPLPAVDTTKDPCQKVKCSRHKICVTQGYQRAMCVNVNRKKLEHRWVINQSMNKSLRDSQAEASGGGSLHIIGPGGKTVLTRGAYSVVLSLTAGVCQHVFWTAALLITSLSSCQRAVRLYAQNDVISSRTFLLCHD